MPLTPRKKTKQNHQGQPSHNTSQVATQESNNESSLDAPNERISQTIRNADAMIQDIDNQLKNSHTSIGLNKNTDISDYVPQWTLTGTQRPYSRHSRPLSRSFSSIHRPSTNVTHNTPLSTQSSATTEQQPSQPVKKQPSVFSFWRSSNKSNKQTKQNTLSTSAKSQTPNSQNHLSKKSSFLGKIGSFLNRSRSSSATPPLHLEQNKVKQANNNCHKENSMPPLSNTSIQKVSPLWHSQSPISPEQQDINVEQVHDPQQLFANTK